MDPRNVQAFAPGCKGVEERIFLSVNRIGQDSGIGPAGAVEAHGGALELQGQGAAVFADQSGNVDILFPRPRPVRGHPVLLQAEAPGFQRDDEGDNISAANPHYCELTGVYWAWKNLDADYVGLAHYRRHFAGEGERGVATQADVEALLAQAPVVLPKKRHYYIETIEDHYGHTSGCDLECSNCYH